MTEKLLAQQRALIQKEPRIEPFFVPIDDGRARALPFLPIGLFRKFNLFQRDSAQKTFMSSGSTNDVRAQHSFSTQGLELYRESSTANFREFLSSFGIAHDAPIISLVPRVSQWPQSSLAAMIDMFKQSGLNIVYFDFENASGDTDHLAELIGRPNSDVVIFGTSFHHLLLAQHQQRDALAHVVRGKRATVIDTGGTKGRTRSFALHEVHEIIQATYATSTSCQVVSEYGMCELTSQAWSLHAPHDGWFRANDSLTPLIIDLDKRCVVHEDNQPGFLAFIDHNNRDSYMAIVSEDLAVMDHRLPGCFKLLGRAPDASLKGCSLNVKENFQPTTTLKSLLRLRGREILTRQNRERDLSAIVTTLPRETWDEDAKLDLIQSLNTIDSTATTLSKTRIDQRVAIVLSANIPITFLYPTFMCFFRGAKEVHLQLPSIRAHDPISERVRLQISSLVEAIAPFLQPMSLFLHSDRDISFSVLKDFDAAIIFGSDATIQTFRTALTEHGPTEMIGLGSVANTYILAQGITGSTVATTCSRWLGRGCLTPVALIGDDPYPEFLNEFVEALETNFSKRLKVAGLEQSFFHRHVLLDIESALKSIGSNPSDHIRRGKSTFIVDLRRLDTQAMLRCDFPFSNAGCGLVYLISQTQLDALPALKTYPVDPGFFDPHMNKTWSEWI